MDPTCFNVNCHSIITNARVDRVLVHVKDQLPRGQGAAACAKCQTAVQQALVQQQISQPPSNTCQICCGVNNPHGPTLLQLYANGLHTLWVCDSCKSVQGPVLQANFYLAQKNIPPHDSEAVFTFDLPTEPPKRPSRQVSSSPPPKRRMTRHTTSSSSQPWETVMINTLNQQERIMATLDQLGVLQNEQQRNIKKMHHNLPNVQDYEEVKDANETLTEEVTNLSKKVQTLEESRQSAQLTLIELRNAMGSAPSSVTQLLDKLSEQLNSKGDDPMSESAPPAPDYDPMAT